MEKKCDQERLIHDFLGISEKPKFTDEKTNKQTQILS